MPIYEYRCYACGTIIEKIRQVENRDKRIRCPSCQSTSVVKRIVSVPVVDVWDADRKYPNLRKEGDGAVAFPSREAYKQHLVKNGVHELGVHAKIKRAHGNKVLGTWR